MPPLGMTRKECSRHHEGSTPRDMNRIREQLDHTQLRSYSAALLPTIPNSVTSWEETRGISGPKPREMSSIRDPAMPESHQGRLHGQGTIDSAEECQRRNQQRQLY